MRRDPIVLRHVQDWQIVEVDVHDLDDLLGLAGHLRPTTDSSEDLVRRLLILGRDDELAARVVIQRLLPGLLALVRRWRGRAPSSIVFEELLGAAWMVVRTYRVSRRPSCHVAALLRSTEHLAFRAELRRRCVEVEVTDPAALDLTDTDHHLNPFDEVMRLLTTARDAGLEDEHLDLLRRLLIASEQRDVAADLGVTARTVRNRRDVVVHRLRELGVT